MLEWLAQGKLAKIQDLNLGHLTQDLCAQFPVVVQLPNPQPRPRHG